jgi:hypothetical protein
MNAGKVRKLITKLSHLSTEGNLHAQDQHHP